MEVKTIKDYYEKVQECFPTVSLKDIKTILNYGWKQLYLLNSYGADVQVVNRNMWCYFGRLNKNPIKHFQYYIRKLSTKIRIMHNKKKIPWDGYYYFARSENLYQEYLNLKNSKGRPKKWFTFKDVIMYLIYDECSLREYNNKYIFRIPYTSLINYTFKVDNLVTDKAELITVREPLKFKDILVYYNDYDVL